MLKETDLTGEPPESEGVYEVEDEVVDSISLLSFFGSYNVLLDPVPIEPFGE